MGVHQRSAIEIFEAVAIKHSSNPESFYLEYGNESSGSVNAEGVFE